jgi:glycine oxidase ThiO
MSRTDQHVLVIGAGIIGLSIGWELARSGSHVDLFDSGEAGQEASRVAAGMLAPDAELGFEETTLHALNTESRRRWPDFAARLEADTGVDVGLRTEGTLVVADDRDAAEALRRRYHFQQDQGLGVEWLSGEDARSKEPFLAPRLSAAIWSPTDHQVNNRAVVEALQKGVVQHGGHLHEHTPIEAVDPSANRPALTTADGDRVEGDVVIVAAGAWSRSIDGLDGALPIRPVKGETLGLNMTATFDLQHVVRGPEAYVVPKADGRLVVGATAEEKGFNGDVTAGGLYENLEGGWEVVPGLLDLSVDCTCSSFRPASRDNAPVLGPAAPGVVAATGHYRHGILLTPVTAQEIARYVRTGTLSDWIEPFQPARFDTVSHDVAQA